MVNRYLCPTRRSLFALSPALIVACSILALMGNTANAQPAPPAAITGQLWAWQSSSYRDTTVVEATNPGYYTITFGPGGALDIRADCNTVMGTYTVIGPRISIQLGPSTLAACGPDSQDSVFLRD